MDSARAQPRTSEDSTPAPETLSPASSAAVYIDQGVICLHCHYNLRGLAVDGNCPECGSPVASSINPTREPLPPSYRYSRLILLTAGVASAALIMAGCILTDDHRLARWYLSHQMGGIGLMLAPAVWLNACGFLLVSGRARRDALVWLCLLLIPLNFIGMELLTRARE